jgi:hypothetical protein
LYLKKGVASMGDTVKRVKTTGWTQRIRKMESPISIDSDKNYEYKKIPFPQETQEMPAYKSKIVGTYAYGLQKHNEEQERKIKEGRVIPGGCVIDHGQPVWGCKFCGTDYYRLTDEEYL